MGGAGGVDVTRVEWLQIVVRQTPLPPRLEEDVHHPCHVVPEVEETFEEGDTETDGIFVPGSWVWEFRGLLLPGKGVGVQGPLSPPRDPGSSIRVFEVLK